MNIAIIFIGTNKYLNFFPLFYEKCEENFLLKCNKTYFVFTDGVIEPPPNNVSIIHQQHLNWPNITLDRFKIINQIREKLLDYDWLVFMDADTLVVDKIIEEEFFSEKPFFGVHHPCSYLKLNPHNESPGAFETNKNSTAYLEFSELYYQGCFWGAKTPYIFKLLDTLEKNIEQDKENDIIAIWHDESHLNWFLHNNIKDVKTFGPEYAFPEVFKDYCNFKPKIVHLAKDNSTYQL